MQRGVVAIRPRRRRHHVPFAHHRRQRPHGALGAGVTPPEQAPLGLQPASRPGPDRAGGGQQHRQQRGGEARCRRPAPRRKPPRRQALRRGVDGDGRQQQEERHEKQVAAHRRHPPQRHREGHGRGDHEHHEPRRRGLPPARRGEQAGAGDQRPQRLRRQGKVPGPVPGGPRHTVHQSFPEQGRGLRRGVPVGRDPFPLGPQEYRQVEEQRQAAGDHQRRQQPAGAAGPAPRRCGRLGDPRRPQRRAGVEAGKREQRGGKDVEGERSDDPGGEDAGGEREAPPPGLGKPQQQPRQHHEQRALQHVAARDHRKQRQERSARRQPRGQQRRPPGEQRRADQVGRRNQGGARQQGRQANAPRLQPEQRVAEVHEQRMEDVVADVFVERRHFPERPGLHPGRDLPLVDPYRVVQIRPPQTEADQRHGGKRGPLQAPVAVCRAGSHAVIIGDAGPRMMDSDARCRSDSARAVAVTSP